MTPYSSPADRARALYRIPASPAAERVVEACVGRDPLVFASVPAARIEPSPARTTEGAVHWYRHSGANELGASASNDALAPGAFELVVLHRTLDDVARGGRSQARAAALALLVRASELLAPGGLVAGTMADVASAPAALWRRLAGKGVADAGSGGRDCSVGELIRLLARAGFIDVHLFRVLPSCESPLRLVGIHPAPARAMLRHAAGTGRSRPISFALKRLAVECGAYEAFLGRSLFFWARKPC